MLPFSVRNWPLRARMAVLLLAASLVPLAVAAWLDIRQAREQLVTDTAGDLAARSEQMVRELDALNQGYRRSANVLAHSPQVIDYAQRLRTGAGAAEAGTTAQTHQALQDLLSAFSSSERFLRGAALLDAAGVVRAATEKPMVGVDLSFRQYVRTGLNGRFVISDPFVAEPQVGQETIST